MARRRLERLARCPASRASLFDDGRVRDQMLGRRLVHATVEYQRPLHRHALGTVAVAAFADSARAWRRTSGSASQVEVDVGLGLRVHAAALSGTLRIDVARGLRDGRMSLSAGVGTGWGD